jgi:biopolymer transport protein ExbB
MRPCRSRSSIVFALALATLFSLGTSQARAWWNDDWSFRKEITFDLSPAAGAITASPAEVPVLLRLSLGNFTYFNDTKPDGSDLRVMAADDKTPLAFHIERYDAQAQMAFIWVRVPQLAGNANSTKIFLYYGNKKATAASDAAATFDKNVALDYHFGPPAGSPQDSTAYKSEPAIFQGEALAASLIGAGVHFNGTASISIPATGALQLVPTQGYTASAWVRVEQAQAQAHVLSQGDAGNAVTLGIDNMTPFAQIGPAAAPTKVAAQQPLNASEWTHLAVRVGSGKLTLLVNGVEAGTVDVTVPTIGGSLTVGAGAGNANQLIGDIDELQVSNVARPTEWLLAAAKSQGVVAPLIQYGGDAQKEGGGEGYFATTMRNVTPDGWVVIVLCLLLLVLSLIIMAGKIFYLGRVSRGNNAFLEQFRLLKDDPTVLDKAPDAVKLDGEQPFGKSTLYELYHNGVFETRKRLEGQSAGAARVKSLGSQSTEAIRATMDATLVRATQKLQAQMVWLTIAIAGGPFLGLLGTVVGVMITFAAIAQSGDVNVNAIAPGIAAALAATVAGLGVAIPALFGYNYLNTRIRDIVADMRVFVDEFVTRIAETYA